MSTGSSLTPENLPAGRDRIVDQGHGTRYLGPSDSSDSGSDLMGAPGTAFENEELGVHAGTTSDPEATLGNMTAGPDIGDADLSSDSDRYGTGERASADRDVLSADGADIDVDQIRAMPQFDDRLDEAEEAEIDPVYPEKRQATEGRRSGS